MATSSYEFSEDQNVIISLLTSRMNLFSWSLVVAGPLIAGLGLFADLLLRSIHPGAAFIPSFMVTFLVGLVVAALGLSLRKSLQEFRQIVVTQGSDLNHLMLALTQLRLFFQVGGALAWSLVAILVAVTLVFITHANEVL
jgi:hypothetical protein